MQVLWLDVRTANTKCQPQHLQVANLQPATCSICRCDPVLTAHPATTPAGCQPAAQEPCISSICCLQPSPHIQPPRSLHPQHLLFATQSSRRNTTCRLPTCSPRSLHPQHLLFAPSPHIQPHTTPAGCRPAAQDLSMCCLRPSPHIQPQHLRPSPTPSLPTCSPISLHPEHLLFESPHCLLSTCSPSSPHPQQVLFAIQFPHPATTPACCQPAAQDPCIRSMCCLRPAPHIQPQHLQVANLQPKTPASPAFVVCDPVRTSSHNTCRLPTCSPRPLHTQHLLFATQSPRPATTPAGCQPAAQDPCIRSMCCLRPAPHIQPQHLQVANLQPKTPASPAFVVCDPVRTSSHNTCRLPTCSPRSLHPQHLLFAPSPHIQPHTTPAGCRPAAQHPSMCCLRPSPHIQPQHLQVANLQPKIPASPAFVAGCQPAAQDPCIPSSCCLRQVLTSSHSACRLPTCSPRSLHPQHLLFATQSPHPATTPACCQPKIPASPAFVVCDPVLTDPCIPSICCLRPSPHIQPQHLQVANLQPKITASPAFVAGCQPAVKIPAFLAVVVCDKSSHPATTPAGCQPAATQSNT